MAVSFHHVSYIAKAQTRVFEPIDLAFNNQVDALSTRTNRFIHSFNNVGARTVGGYHDNDDDDGASLWCVGVCSGVCLCEWEGEGTNERTNERCWCNKKKKRKN